MGGNFEKKATAGKRSKNMGAATSSQAAREEDAAGQKQENRTPRHASTERSYQIFARSHVTSHPKWQTKGSWSPLVSTAILVQHGRQKACEKEANETIEQAKKKKFQVFQYNPDLLAGIYINKLYVY